MEKPPGIGDTAEHKARWKLEKPAQNTGQDKAKNLPENMGKQQG